MKIVVASWVLFALAVIIPSTNLLLSDDGQASESPTIITKARPAHSEIQELRPSYPIVTTEVLSASFVLTSHPDPEPDISVAKDLNCDGLGHCWKWGAWRNADDSLWVEPTYYVQAPQSPTYNPPAPVAASGGSLSLQCGRYYPPDVEKWAHVAAQYSWDLCEWANIVDCESDGMEWISNPSSGACGVMQHLPCQYLGDGAGSIALGFEKYASRGWQPWTVGGCYPY